jgi:branched-chain amino acid transport system permease protein
MEQKESMVKRGWWLILLLIASFIAPLFVTEFYLTVLCEALVMSMLALSFNLLFGYMGQLSFGQAAFYGLGGILLPCSL